jgi:hypothetical protein
MRMKTVTLFACASALSACEPMAAPPTDTSALSTKCCGAIGVCIYEGFLSEQLASRLPSSECEQDSVCTPVEWSFGATGVPSSCRTAGDLEGRCLPSCMPELSAQAGQLQRETCDPDFLCVPCFDPLTGEDTEACRIEADPGPSEPAPTPAPCCDGDETVSDRDAEPTAADCAVE